MQSASAPAMSSAVRVPHRRKPGCRLVEVGTLHGSLRGNRLAFDVIINGKRHPVAIHGYPAPTNQGVLTGGAPPLSHLRAEGDKKSSLKICLAILLPPRRYLWVIFGSTSERVDPGTGEP